MNTPSDDFEWAARLECPPSFRSRAATKLLNQGIASLMWDKLATRLYPTHECLAARKNALLYKLRHDEKDALVQQVRSRAQLRETRKPLESRFEVLEKECEEREFRVRQKQQQLHKLKSLRHSTDAKSQLLRTKFNQMKTNIEDCTEMRLVCQHLMPATLTDVDSKVVEESLSSVSAISSRMDRKAVLNKISESLMPVEISALWNILLPLRTRDTEELVSLSIRDVPETESKNKENCDLGMARACGQYVTTTARSMIHRAKASEQEKLVIECIENIENCETNSVDVSEWLALTLEVRKFEVEQRTLQSEIEELKRELEAQGLLAEELSSLEAEMHSIDTRVERCVQDIQKSLTLLKPAGLLISHVKDKITNVLQKIVALRSSEQNVDYLDIDLNTELNFFHDNLQLEALRKIILKDNVGAYRHTRCCISEAPLLLPQLSTSSSKFPMIRAPIYSLLECYKSQLTKSWLAKLTEETTRDEIPNLDELSFPVPADFVIKAIDVLNTTDFTCERISEELQRFHVIFDTWDNQTVQKAMSLDESLVNGASFKEWTKRYSTLVHMLQRIKYNSAFNNFNPKISQIWT